MTPIAKRLLEAAIKIRYMKKLEPQSRLNERIEKMELYAQDKSGQADFMFQDMDWKRQFEQWGYVPPCGSGISECEHCYGMGYKRKAFKHYPLKTPIEEIIKDSETCKHCNGRGYVPKC